MLPGMNQKKMSQMMKKMGIQQTEIEASEVIIRTQDKELVFSYPNVSKVNMMGQETYQIVGTPEVREVKTFEINDEDIKTVMDQANVSEDIARKKLEETKGDLAEAILELTS